jgi:hypothetical protein
MPNWQRQLTGERQSSEMKFMTETRLVGGLHQAWPKFPVHFDGGADDSRSEGVME